MCDKVVCIEPRSLAFVPIRFKIEDTCIGAVGNDAYILGFVPDHFKTQKICNEAIRENPAAFVLVPDRFKTKNLYHGP